MTRIRKVGQGEDGALGRCPGPIRQMVGFQNVFVAKGYTVWLLKSWAAVTGNLLLGFLGRVHKVGHILANRTIQQIPVAVLIPWAARPIAGRKLSTYMDGDTLIFST
jgi:hypothetical protein